MRVLLVLLPFALAHGTPALAQEVRASAVAGELFSQSASLPAGETSALLLEVPASGHTILTQACVQQILPTRFPGQRSPLGPRVVGSETGEIPTAQSCTRYVPGVALAPGETLTCELLSAFPVDLGCVVTGVRQGGPR